MQCGVCLHKYVYEEEKERWGEGEGEEEGRQRIKERMNHLLGLQRWKGAKRCGIQRSYEKQEHKIQLKLYDASNGVASSHWTTAVIASWMLQGSWDQSWLGGPRSLLFLTLVPAWLSKASWKAGHQPCCSLKWTLAPCQMAGWWRRRENLAASCAWLAPEMGSLRTPLETQTKNLTIEICISSQKAIIILSKQGHGPCGRLSATQSDGVRGWRALSFSCIYLSCGDTNVLWCACVEVRG